jgi:hypothetical protein
VNSHSPPPIVRAVTRPLNRTAVVGVTTPPTPERCVCRIVQVTGNPPSPIASSSATIGVTSASVTVVSPAADSSSRCKSPCVIDAARYTTLSTVTSTGWSV